MLLSVWSRNGLPMAIEESGPSLRSTIDMSITSGFTGSCVMKDGCCIDKVKSLWKQGNTKAQWQLRKAIRAGAQMD